VLKSTRMRPGTCWRQGLYHQPDEELKMGLGLTRRDITGSAISLCFLVSRRPRKGRNCGPRRPSFGSGDLRGAGDDNHLRIP